MMKIDQDKLKHLLWIIPAIIVFILALIPTIKYQWPLDWDIIYHIQYAQVYAKYGFVLTNPLLNAPFGLKIGYPPIFDLLIAYLGLISKIDFFQIARFIQPFLPMFIVLSVSYVGRKLYGNIAGISAGFLIIASLLLGNRLIFPIPENLALIFLPLGVYFYYCSLKKKSFKYALLAGSLLILLLLIHQVAPIVLFLVITMFTIVELIIYRNFSALRNYGEFLIIPIILFVLGIVGLILLFPNIVHNILQSGILASTGYVTSIAFNESLSISSYGNLGLLGLVFGFIGVVYAVMRRHKIDVFMLSWILVILLLINAHLLGINVLASRFLVYILIPVSILGGFGLSEIYHKLKNYNRFSSKNFRIAFLISIFALATFDGVLTMESPLIAYFAVDDQYGSFQIAPPSQSEVELANWFNSYGDKSKSILSNNLFPLTFVSTQTGMALVNDQSFVDFNNTLPESYFTKNNIGYVVLDKRLSFQSTNGTFYKVEYDGYYYRLFYYSGDIQANLNSILPSYLKVVYQNKDFIVCEVE